MKIKKLKKWYNENRNKSIFLLLHLLLNYGLYVINKYISVSFKN